VEAAGIFVWSASPAAVPCRVKFQKNILEGGGEGLGGKMNHWFTPSKSRGCLDECHKPLCWLKLASFDREDLGAFNCIILELPSQQLTASAEHQHVG